MSIQISVPSRLRAIALELVDNCEHQVDVKALDACLDFFDGLKTPDLWLMTIEARGSLAVLRSRITDGLPLDDDLRSYLVGIAEAHTAHPEVGELSRLLTLSGEG